MVIYREAAIGAVLEETIESIACRPMPKAIKLVVRSSGTSLLFRSV
jgi:hypothetical protein